MLIVLIIVGAYAILIHYEQHYFYNSFTLLWVNKNKNKPYNQDENCYTLANSVAALIVLIKQISKALRIDNSHVRVIRLIYKKTILFLFTYEYGTFL